MGNQGGEEAYDAWFEGFVDSFGVLSNSGGDGLRRAPMDFAGWER